MFLATKQPNRYPPHFEDVELIALVESLSPSFLMVLQYSFRIVFNPRTQNQSFPRKMTEIFHCHYLPQSLPFSPHHSTLMYHLKDYEEIIIVAI